MTRTTDSATDSFTTKVALHVARRLRDWRARYRRSWLSRTPADRSSGIEIDTFDGFTIAYRGNTADEKVLRASFSRDIFFANVPEYEPRIDHVIIDVGAHIGTFAVLAASIAHTGRVYSIEANRDSFNLLRINVALNKLNNITVCHAAMSGSDGSCVLYHDSGNWGHSIVHQLSGSSESVAMCSLGSFLSHNDISHCHFMKLNCEGAEFPILLNTDTDTLRKFGTILVLYHCDLWSQNSERDLISHLASSGFTCAVRQQSRFRGWIIASRQTSE